jgi:predicted transcriptional regulator of viral defense system
MSVRAAILGLMTVRNLSGSWRLAGIRTTSELRAAGKSPTEIRTLLRRGTLIQVRRGVYARADLAADLLARPSGDHLLRTAAALASYGPAAASHESAALIYGMSLLKKAPEQVTLTRPVGLNRAGQPGLRVHSAELPATHVTVQHGMRVTTAARTVVDLGRTLDFRAGVATADSALHTKLVTKEELAAIVADCERWRGIRKAAEVVAFADKLSESVLESIARVVFREVGLPPPELQVWAGDQEVVGRVDFLWRQFRTVAEVDGLLKYADPHRAIQQLERDKRLRDAGFEVVHFTWQEITQQPAYVATAVRTAFRRGSRKRN